MKKAILLLSPFAVSSCAGTPLVPSSTEEPSSTPEATSDTSKESEASSEESIDPDPVVYDDAEAFLEDVVKEVIPPAI